VRAERSNINPPTEPQSFRVNELLVKFRETASENDKNTVARLRGTAQGKKLRGRSGIEKLSVPTGQAVEAFAALLRTEPAVEFAEPNFQVSRDQFKPGRAGSGFPSSLMNPVSENPFEPELKTSQTRGNPIYPGLKNVAPSLNSQNELGPNDARFAEQWTLNNTGQNAGTFGSDIRALEAWQKTTGSNTTVIAVIDSGINFTHPDLVNNKWTNTNPTAEGDLNGWDYVTDSGVIKDEQGHGTAVAGIIAAEGDNKIGIAGVMWHASLMSLRVLDRNGVGDVGSAVEGIDYAVSHGANVINISWGTSAESIALKQAIQRATAAGVLVVCSAGNDGRDLDRFPYYPASYSIQNLISVAATDNVDRLAPWSNYGSRTVTLAAPGTNVLTTDVGGEYSVVSGTSASAPLVAGVAGLIKSAAPQLGAREIASIIETQIRRTSSLDQRVTTGGILQAADSVKNIQASPALPPRPAITGGGPDGNFATTPPARTTTPPSHVPNLDEIRRSQPSIPRAKAPIESNMMCADCDPYSGGGGSGNYPAGDPNFSTARMRPRNETGQSGVDLGSRNFNWETPILSLPGRAGLNLDLTLYLNSLVWTQDGSFIKYNADLGSPAPGFQLGLPKLQQRFTDAVTGTYAYVMVTPSGARVEMRQIGSSNIYESQDANYTQLDTNTMIVRTTDGTQFAFVAANNNGEYRCSQIKDRNGNYISATYDVNNGHLLTITDTLSRVITFAYDGNGNLSAIQQNWGGVTHNWATFFYGQVWVAPAFGGGLQTNGPNNINVTVLTQVSLHDGSSYTFEYNTAFGQVRRINHYESDGRLRNYTWYNMNTSAGQTDCPRFTEQHDWAEMWNNGNEAITYFSVAADGSSSQKTMPDGTIYKEFFATTGWQSGLTTLMEVWSGGVRKKWMTTSWTQDNEALSYQKNARITDTSVYDEAGNRRRISINYGNYAAYSLPYQILEYAADGTTAWRSKYMDYNLTADYVNRRIIGLPNAIHIVDHTIAAYVSKTTYEYDWANGSNTYLIDQGTATQHDNSYGGSLFIGRGNLCAVRRWNVNGGALNDGNQAMWTSFTGYNTNGSIIFSADGLGHETRISYSDVFSDGNNHNTFAYPTTVTDAELYASTTQYNYDFGAPTRTQEPAPAGQPQGRIQTFSYDGAARLERVTTANTGAYTRYVYGPYYFQSFSTVNNVTDEKYSCQILDGAGRVTSAAANHPGSTGGYIGQLTTYDVMGRAVQQTNPTEITGSWAPVGDDPAWVWTYQAYDWNGRPTLTTLPDGNTREVIYGGCGCAGSAVVTSRDERGRRRRTTMDVAGRSKQVDELNWNQSVDSTTIYSYNALDQVTQINKAGQIRTLEYDGHGRLWRLTTPEQGTTTYSYYGDDTLNTTTDARGAKTIYSYNPRHLLSGLTYDLSNVIAGQNVQPTSNATFGYDAAGNRTSMTDGLGSMSYAYDQLSRLTSETRTFTGVGSFTLSYGYNLAGQLTSITNPWNAQEGYSYDAAGRATSVSGANYAGVSSYVNSISYRAFGIKQMAYANGRTLSVGYDSRLRLTAWSIPGVMRRQFSYLWENTGRVEFVRDLDDQTLDRWFAYDHVGRLGISRSGSEARLAIGEQVPLAYDGPYSQAYGYDVWGNRTHLEGWGGVGRTEDHTYTNNRRNGMQYDAAGNLVDGNWFTFSYDAASRQVRSACPGYTLDMRYDGNGLRAKKTDNGDTIYYLRSSVLGGQVVAEIYGGGVSYSGSGWWLRGYVYLGQQLLAVQAGGVFWTHQEPVTKSQRLTDINGNITSTVELDPFGADTTRSQNELAQPHRFTSYDRDGDGADDAMFRRYNRWWGTFDQPDPYDGSYNLGDPQSLNRYSYTQNDPVNSVDPTGLMWIICQFSGGAEGGITGGYCVVNMPDWGGYNRDRPGGGGQQPTPTPTPTPQTQKPIYCQPDVIKAMERAWQRTANGTKGTEAGFVLNGSLSNYTIVDAKSGNTQRYEKMSINLPGNPAGATFAVFHVHPNNGGGYPSTPDNNALGNKQGDTGVADQYKIPFYVISSRGLSVYDPAKKNDPNKGMTMLRQNLDWTKVKGCK